MLLFILIIAIIITCYFLHLKANLSREKAIGKIINSQMQFGKVDISQIEFDLLCHDVMPKSLMYLTHIY
jgi:hypothetical protein